MGFLPECRIFRLFEGTIPRDELGPVVAAEELRRAAALGSDRFQDAGHVFSLHPALEFQRYQLADEPVTDLFSAQSLGAALAAAKVLVLLALPVQHPPLLPPEPLVTVWR